MTKIKLMPKILMVKTSSMGDVIHNLPVVNDIHRYFPEAQIDWVVEEAYQAVPAMHLGVNTVLPVKLRRWRKTLWKAETWREINQLSQHLRSRRYDFILDSQGLIKSALITKVAHGVRCGFNWPSAREPLRWFYDRVFDVPWSLHAVERNRYLAAQALGYALDGRADYGIQAVPASFSWLPQPYCVMLHATSRREKLWPEPSWVELGVYLNSLGVSCVLPWGSLEERARSERLANRIKLSVVPPQLALTEATFLLAGAKAVIGVDTGLAHLAAALNVPVIGIYCATHPDETGIYSETAINLGYKNHPPAASSAIVHLQRVMRR